MAAWYLWHVGGEPVALTNEPVPPQDIDGRIMTEMKVLDQCEATNRQKAEATFQSPHPMDSGGTGNPGCSGLPF
jgi:hypothetical protein